MCVYMCVWGVVLINKLVLQLAPPQTKISGSAPGKCNHAKRNIL